MPKINLLTSKVYNRIAAGEVVERPASIIKELIENSIDANAQNIRIEIVDSGITSIMVSDDGCGMEKKDLINSIKAHATSKINNVSDLDNIKTLGFRGEALPSIASVTKLQISSRTKDMEVGYSLYTEGGENLSISEIGINVGTIVEAKNIFFNTPAREKFLKSHRSEESEISSIISKFILGNPYIKFTYYSNNNLVYQSFGDGFESAMTQVFGTNIINSCFNIDAEKNGIIINGYISRHHFTKGNRTHQYIFLNNRIISNQTISAAISNAYAPYLMKGRFPFYALNISVPYEIVDVNVHPNKADVRFANNQIIYSTIYSIITKVLDGSSDAVNIITEQGKPNEIMPDIKHNKNVTYSKTTVDKYHETIYLNDSANDGKKNISNDDIFLENKKFLESLIKNNSNINNDSGNLISSFSNNAKDVEQTLLKNEDLSTFEYIGQALETYLIVQNDNQLFFIDQHAAHERLLYDRLIDSVKSNKVVVQPLIIPFILNVNASESTFLLSNMKYLISIGFDISEFGLNSFKISGIPLIISNLNLDNFFNDLFADLNELKNIELSDILTDKLAQTACKHAIKGGERLNQSQINELLKQISGNLGMKCPHGRPVVVKLSKKEIDKWFKRIL